MGDYSSLNKEIYRDIIEILLACDGAYDDTNDDKGACWHWGRVEMSLIANHVERKINQSKREAIAELLALHKQDRAKVNSQCDTLINMSTVDRYLAKLIQ